MSIVFIVVVLEISTILVQNLILNLRLLHKKFLAVPAQAIKARLFGVTKIKMEELTALVSPQIMYGLFCTIREIEMFRLRMYRQSQSRHGQW